MYYSSETQGPTSVEEEEELRLAVVPKLFEVRFTKLVFLVLIIICERFLKFGQDKPTICTFTDIYKPF